MNILTTNGFVGRYVTDWAGPGGGARVGVKIRLGAPNYPGDTMTMTGSVTGRADRKATTACGRGEPSGARTASATT